MLICIPEVLTKEQVAHCRKVMGKAEWVDGRVTAGAQSATVKHNNQLPEGSPASNQLGDFESGAVAGLFGPVVSVVAGGIGTLIVVGLVALRWPEVRRMGRLEETLPPQPT